MGTGGNPCAEWWAIETSPSEYCSSNATTNYRSISSVPKKPYTAEVALSQALEQELARGQNANNIYQVACVQLVPILTAMRVNDEQLLGFLQSMNPNQSNNGVKAVLRQNHALESKTLNNCKQLKSLL